MDGSGGPKIKACLLHPMLKAKREFIQGSVKYGLCGGCLRVVVRYKTLMHIVQNEIINRVSNLRRKDE